MPCHAVNRVFLLGGQSNMVDQGINYKIYGMLWMQAKAMLLKGSPPAQADIVRAAQVTVAESTPYVSWFDTDACQMVNSGHYGTQDQLDMENDFAVENLAYIPSVLKICTVGSNTVLRWDSRGGATYTLLGTGDLAATLPDNVLTNPLPAESAVFYVIERDAP